MKQHLAVPQSSCPMNFAATFAAQGLQSEYAVGVLVSMMVGQNLIASALGLASGLTEALLKLVRLGMGHNGGGKNKHQGSKEYGGY